MRHGIVEGEPGIFPQPIADLLRKIGGFFDRRRSSSEPQSTTDDPKDDKPKDDGGDTRPG